MVALAEETIMVTTTAKDIDQWMRHAVMRELDWDRRINASDVAATAKDGAVTLTGYINTYAGKLAAERAAKRVRGVRAVANDLIVRLGAARTDTDIAADVAHALRVNAAIPEAVQAAVHNAVVTLTGEAKWSFQAREAERTVRHITGVRAVHNYLTVIPRAIAKDVQHRIIEALHHNANVDARHIAVKITGDTAELTGTVGTWLQRETAERAAANAPGIRYVHNNLAVMPPQVDTAEDELC
jgi:osmotically-inducible protein OsmY